MKRMFDNIVESVLAEISAEDAYNKFYNSIPINVYNEIVGIYGKFDNLLKMVFNYLKDNCNDEKVAAVLEFIKGYKSAKNEIRVELSKKIKSGEIESFIDLRNELSELSENGVETLATMQNNGFVKMYDDDNFLLTITTTYEANHHFYGNSSWCTASDRLGRYDGWFYFMSYILDTDYDEIEDEYDFLLKWSKYDVKAALWQLTYKTSGEIYQFQLFGNGKFGQICDFKDNSYDYDEFNFGGAIEKIFRENAAKAVEMTKESLQKEYPYQTKKNKYVEEKRAEIRRKIAERTIELNNKIDAHTDKKIKLIDEKFDELFRTNLLHNSEFLSMLVENTEKIEALISAEDGGISKYNEMEDMLKKQNYACAYANELYNGIVALEITPCFGTVLGMQYGENGFPHETERFVLYNYYESKKLNRAAVVIASLNDGKYSVLDVEYSNTKIKCFPAYDACLSFPYGYEKDEKLKDYVCFERTIKWANDHETYSTDILSLKSFKKATLPCYTEKILMYGNTLMVKNSSTFDDCYFLVDLNDMKKVVAFNSTPFKENRHLKYYILQDPLRKDMYIAADKLIYIGKSEVDIDDWVGYYIGQNGLIVVYPIRGDYSTIIYSREKGEVVCKNVNLYRNYVNNTYFAEYKNGEKINFK